MMEGRGKVIICSVVGFLGLLSAALGFAAEAKRIKGSQIQITASTCIYPHSPALGLAISAAVALLIAQVIISAVTGCFCCKRGSYQSNTKSRLGLICFVISWVTFVNALRLYLSGAVLNGHHVNEDSNFDTFTCYFVRPGVFAGAAVLSLATVVLVIVCYLAWDSAKNSNNSGGGTAAAPNQGGIAMGHPQFPPPQYPPGPPPQYPPPQYPPGPPPQYPPPHTEGPVFVHEDTYMRRQQYPPPHTEGPVFVHEDTYMRRQFT